MNQEQERELTGRELTLARLKERMGDKWGLSELDRAKERNQAIGALLNDPTLSLTEIADRLGLSPAGVSQVQAKYFPKTPRRKRGGRGIEVERLEQIRVLLADPTLQIKEIAARLQMNPQAIYKIQANYFPETPKRPRGGIRAGDGNLDLEERNHRIGALLADPALSLIEIADRFGLSRERVRQIQVKHFPGTPKRPRAVTKKGDPNELGTGTGIPAVTRPEDHEHANGIGAEGGAERGDPDRP